MSSPTFLQKIAALTEQRIEKRKKVLSLADLKKKVESIHEKRVSFETLFSQGSKPRFIAEVKRKSPSLGLLNQGAKASELAGKYFEAGATAVSILTEPDHFMGSIEDFLSTRELHPNLPLLQKDFVVSDYQIYEAKLIGANCVLLIVAMLDEKKMQELFALALSLSLSVLVEVHSERELKVALNLGAKIIGVNNRDLHSLQISLDVSRKLAALIPDHVIAISESGISKVAEIQELLGLGYDGFLIGSSLMQGESPEKNLKVLIEECQ